MTPSEYALDPADFLAGKYRAAVGGMWDEIGTLQFEFMKTQGLMPGQKLIDIGCGSLRGGIHFAKYLNEGNYYGIDLDSTLIEAGTLELAAVGALRKRPQLLVNDCFEMDRFGVSFDYALAQSLFTHLSVNSIVRCLVETRKVLRQQGKFFATFFEAPHEVHLDTLVHAPGNVITHFDRDPYHYTAAEFKRLGALAGLSVELVGAWGHPRGQQMLLFQRLI